MHVYSSTVQGHRNGGGNLAKCAELLLTTILAIICTTPGDVSIYPLFEENLIFQHTNVDPTSPLANQSTPQPFCYHEDCLRCSRSHGKRFGVYRPHVDRADGYFQVNFALQLFVTTSKMTAVFFELCALALLVFMRLGLSHPCSGCNRVRVWGGKVSFANRIDGFVPLPGGMSAFPLG